MSVLQDIGLKVQDIVDSSFNCANYLINVSKTVDQQAKKLDHLLDGNASASDMTAALLQASSLLSSAAISLQDAAGTGNDWISSQVGSSKQKTLTR